MSDNERKDETEVEGHGIPHRFGADDEPAEEGETEVEAHVHRTANVRMDAPSNI
jgi:hypothetical protein